MDIKFTAPSFSTIMLWVKKIGCYQLQSVKEKSDDWIIIIDESIGIGQEKLLVVLGIRQSNIDFSRPLKILDLEPITIKSRDRWTGEDIALELEIVKTKVGKVIYAVTDAGSTLIKGLRLSGISRIYDITHAIAICLERTYKNDAEFKDFVYQARQMRSILCCGKNSHLIPPNQRSKSRFLNIDIMSKWGMDVLLAFNKNKLLLSEADQLQWVKEHKKFLIEMNSLMSIIEKISVVLKNEGLSKKSTAKCLTLLSKCNAGRLKQFKVYMVEYLEANSKQITIKSEKLLCTSDIIESTFGKFKNELSKNQMCGITDAALIIAAFTANLTTDIVNKAIDNYTVKTIEKWRKENLCVSLIKKRNAVFGCKKGEYNFDKIAI